MTETACPERATFKWLADAHMANAWEAAAVRLTVTYCAEPDPEPPYRTSPRSSCDSPLPLHA